MLTGLLLLFLFDGPKMSRDIWVDSVWLAIHEEEIAYPEIVLRQAVLETGWFKAEFLMERNNLFGFKGQSGYLRFPNWRASVAYYKKWQLKNFHSAKHKDYYSFLVKIKYASSSQYIQRLKAIRIKHMLADDK